MNFSLSIFISIITYYIIPIFRPMFIKSNLYGIDMSKLKRYKVAEAIGVIVSGCYFVIMFLFLPFPIFMQNNNNDTPKDIIKYTEFIVGLLSICCMVFLGFVDDVLNLRWRHKLYLPTIATLPLLMVYYINNGSTYVKVPLQLISFFKVEFLNLSYFYYLYMSLVAVFCTNAINILAGINGLEVGQSIIIALSIILHNFIQIHSIGSIFSIYMLTPFIAVSLSLFYFNFYPAYVFVGDTYCYFAGMIFAVVGILGHFSKTMILFFIPQILNFIYSCPQLFRFIPIPRHRLPKFNKKTKLMNMSRIEFNYNSLNILGKIFYHILKFLKLIDIQYINNDIISINNLTLINLVLKYTGPISEPKLTKYLLYIQIISSIIAFIIRYQLVKLVYNIVE